MQIQTHNRSVSSVVIVQVHHAAKVFIWSDTLYTYVKVSKSEAVSCLQHFGRIRPNVMVGWIMEDGGLLFVGGDRAD